MTHAKPGMKLVRIDLSAYKRVEYSEVLEVPANMTDEQVNEVVNRRYDKVDGSDFTDDPDYWERGHCRADMEVHASEARHVQGRVTIDDGKVKITEYSDDDALLFSAAEAARSGDFAGFWNNTDGWTVLAGATPFSGRAAFSQVMGGVRDARWITRTDANQLVFENTIKDLLRADGFDVAQAADERWYWADEGDRDVDNLQGEFDTEAEAWRDLALARTETLANAGYSAINVFHIPPASEHEEPEEEEEEADAPRA